LRIWCLLNLSNLLIWILIVRCFITTKHRDLFVFYDLRDKKLRCRFRFVYLSSSYRLQIVMWISWNEFLRESFNKFSSEIFCSFFNSLAENLSMINESKDSINWKIIKIVKQACLIESVDEMIKCDVFVLKTKT
jgi:hypothetical protein